MLSMLSRNGARPVRPNPEADEELRQTIVAYLRFRGRLSSDTKARWELVNQFGSVHGDDAVRDALDEAIRLGELTEDENGVHYNPANR